MFLRPTATCLSVFFIVFLICPKRTRPYALLSRRQEDQGIVGLKGTVKGNLIDNKFNIIFNVGRNDIVSFKQSENDEPGFSFTDEEMEKFKLWDKGVVPYYIDLVSFSDKIIRDRIRLFLNGVSTITSLNFIELPSPPEDYDKSRWVFFVNRRGLLQCADNSIKRFTTTGVQRVVLGYDCIGNSGGIASAVLAIAGVPPQHNAPDRDEYIEIIYENIMKDKKHLFKKLKDNEWLFHDIPYDFESAGHTQYYQYSTSGKATFRIKVPYNESDTGNNYGFSNNDILKIRILYNYISKKTGSVSGCDKLFSSGNNLFSIDANNIQIRPKPNKYLGIEDEENLNSGEVPDSKNDEAKCGSAEECFDNDPDVEVFNVTDLYAGIMNEALALDSVAEELESYEDYHSGKENSIDTSYADRDDLKQSIVLHQGSGTPIKNEFLKQKAESLLENLSDYNTDDEAKRVFPK